MNDTVTRTPSPTRDRARLNLAGIIILIVGLGAAAFIYFTSHKDSIAQTTADGSWQDGSLSLADSKKSSRDLEMYSGKLGVFMEDLKTPAAMAVICATSSTLVALGCFALAHRLR